MDCCLQLKNEFKFYKDTLQENFRPSVCQLKLGCSRTTTQCIEGTQQQIQQKKHYLELLSQSHDLSLA